MNIADILATHRIQRPTHPAIESSGRTVTYAELAARVDSAARSLRQLNVTAGNVVAIELGNGIEYLVAIYALAQIGAVSCPIATTLPLLDKRYVLRHVAACYLVCEEDLGDNDEALVPIPVSAICDLTQSATPIAATEPPAFDGAWPFSIIASSGTSAAAKYLQLSHAQMNWRLTTRERHIGFTADDRYLSLISLAFNLGRLRCMRALYAGATVVFPPSSSDLDIVGLIHELRISITNMMPPQVGRAFRHVRGAEPVLKNVRLIIGSSPISADSKRRIRRMVTPHLFEVYAMTETGPVAVSAPADQDRCADAVGRLVDEVEAQVVDATGAVVAAGVVGHIRFRAPHLPSAYLNNLEATKSAFRDGWFYPGDLAAIDAEGYVFLRGRDSEIINNDGAKFHPAEVEAALTAHPAVHEAAVVGWPHPRYGETAVACVVADAPIDFEDLRDFCRTRIASYKAPTAVLFVASLPKTDAGKVSKQAVKALVKRYLATREPH